MSKRFLSHGKLLTICGLVVFVMTGCASRQVKQTETGFLKSYSGFEKSGIFRGVSVYKNLDAAAGRYSKVLIVPLQFDLKSVDKERAIGNEDREELAAYFLQQLESELSGKFETADEAGAGVLMLRSALTDIVPNIGVLNINLWSMFSRSGFGGGALEAELVDSLTEERVMAFVAARKGGKFKDGVDKWGHIKNALEFWARAIAENLHVIKEK